LCGIKSFDSGTVTIAGHDIQKEASLAKQSIGVVYQDSLLDPLLTVAENLKIRSGFYHEGKTAQEEAVINAILAVDAAEFMNQRYKTLSGGQRRRVDIARALLSCPKILFLDEPTTGLDPQSRKHIWESLSRLRETTGVTIFLTTHYMEEAAKADHVVVIDEGKIIASGSPLDLKTAYSFDRGLLTPASPVYANVIHNFLDDQKYAWKTVDQERMVTEVVLKDTMSTIQLLWEMRSCIDSFEILHGSMDDVFLNLTGKELRE